MMGNTTELIWSTLIFIFNILCGHDTLFYLWRFENNKMATSSDSAVDLGFVEKSECWRLLSHFFPSKVGGKPAWLAFKPLPTIEDVSCGICGKPCILLLQVYAPVEDVTTCFHRTMFIFVCKDADCCRYNANNNFVVLRSQLCRDNEFYPNVPPEESCFDPKSDYPRAENFGSSLCAVCGSVGPKRCSRCKKASYCSKEHQTIDWKAGHKKCCAIDPSSNYIHISICMFSQQDCTLYIYMNRVRFSTRPGIPRGINKIFSITGNALGF